MDSDLELFKILHWNANGIRNKSVEFFDYLLFKKISLACLNETKLDPSIRLSHPDFNVFRLDNVDGTISHGG